MAQVELLGKAFTVADEVGTMPLMRFARLAEDGLDADEMEGLAAVYDLLEQCLDPADWTAFQRHATKTRANTEVLMEFVAEVLAMVGERPTERSSDSSDGPPATEPSSEVVSFSQGAQRQIDRLNAEGRPDLALAIRKRQESLTA